MFQGSNYQRVPAHPNQCTKDFYDDLDLEDEEDSDELNDFFGFRGPEENSDDTLAKEAAAALSPPFANGARLSKFKWPTEDNRGFSAFSPRKYMVRKRAYPTPEELGKILH